MPAARPITRDAAAARARKSRTGCLQCKRRRVKCDENKPTCHNCTRVGRQCSYLFTAPSRYPTIAPPVGDLHPVSPALIPHTHPLFSVEDMRLLYHFISSASLTIVDMQDAKQHWQTTVVEIALNHSFLLHSILAFSALHLAHLHPEERGVHANLAANHLARALPDVHPQMASISVQNCDALLAFSLLTVCYTPASSIGTPDSDVSAAAKFDATIEWLRLTRGVISVLEHGRRWFEAGPLSVWPHYFEKSLFGTTPRSEKAKGEDARLKLLEQLWNANNQTPASSAAPHDDAEAAVCAEALQLLRAAFCATEHAETSQKQNHHNLASSYRDTSVVAGSLVWLYKINSRFLQLVESKRPTALILLLHNFIMVKRLEQQHWWAAPLATQITEAVSPLIPAHLQHFIRWPIQEIMFRGRGETAKSDCVDFGVTQPAAPRHPAFALQYDS